MKDIYIVDGVRTPIGGTFKALKNFSAPQLGAFTIGALLQRNKIDKNSIGQVIFGNTVSAGTGQNLARHAAFLAGLPASTPAYTVNSVCGSGLQSLISGAQAVLCNETGMVIVGGAESASQSPFIVKKGDEDKKENQLTDSLIFDGLTCQLTNKHMGELAEHVAEKFRVLRNEQDNFSYTSHKKACGAQDKGKFSKEIVAVDIGNGGVFSVDQRPRRNIDLEKLASLPPAFKKDGTVTAGNSSIPSDGAAAFILASKEDVKKHALKPRARLLGYASIAVEPIEVFTASVPAVKACLAKAGLPLKDIDLFEISEAFAVQAVVTQKELEIPENKMNIFGGDVALGHPLGAAGARILVTLIHALRDQNKKKGIASVCLGGGGAVAMAVEAL